MKILKSIVIAKYEINQFENLKINKNTDANKIIA